MSTAKRGNVLLTAFVAVAASGFGAGRAEAQWGMGGGMGIGFYGGGLVPYVQQPGNFLNQVAIAQMAHVKGRPGVTRYQRLNVYANNPNSYINHVRDNGFVDRYYVVSARSGLLPLRSRPRGRRRDDPDAMTRRPVQADRPAGQLLQRSGSTRLARRCADGRRPEGKARAFDQAGQAVLDEIKKNGVASIATVTDARQKLLDYGRPALQYVRTHETPRVADTFHVFLLSLYDSLAQAANPPDGDGRRRNARLPRSLVARGVGGANRVRSTIPTAAQPPWR